VLSLLLFQFSFVTLSFSQISVDLKDVEGITIELAIESGNGDIRHCILPGGDEDLNFLTIQLEFSDGGTPLIVNSYRIDWGDGSPVSIITGHNSNSIEHVYPGTNNAGNPFYELEIMEINESSFSVSRNIQLDRASFLYPEDNNLGPYCGEEGQVTNVEIEFLAFNLSQNLEWEIDWGDGSTAEILTFDDFTGPDPTISHDYTYTLGTYQYFITLTPGNSLNPTCVTSASIAPLQVTFQEEIIPEISTLGNVVEICEDGANVTFQRATSNPPDNIAGSDEIRWTIQNGATTLLEIPYAPLNAQPAATQGSYTGINTEFTYQFLSSEINSGDVVMVTLFEKNACNEVSETYTINVRSLPEINNITTIPDTITCQTESITIDWDTEANTTYEYLIRDQSSPDPVPGEINNAVSPPFFFSQVTGDYTYWIKATNNAGCNLIEEVDLSVLQDADPVLDIAPVEECGSVTFTVGSNSSNVPAGSTYRYEYSTTNDFSSDVNLIGSTTGATQTFTTTVSNDDSNAETDYFVRLSITTPQGCEYIDDDLNQRITTKYQPKSTPDFEIIAKRVNGVAVDVADQKTFEFCEGDEVTFEALGGSTFGSQFTWSIDGSPEPTSPNTEFTYTVSSNFDLSVSEILDGCTTLTPPVEAVLVNPTPIITAIDQTGNLAFCEDGSTSVTLSATGTDVGQFEWYRFNSGSGFYENTGITGADLTLDEVSKSGVYKVRGTANGCEGELYPAGSGITIEIQPIPLAPDISESGVLEFCESLTNSVELTATQNGGIPLDRIEWWRVGSPDALIETDNNTTNSPDFSSALSSDRLNEFEESGDYYAIAYGTGADECSVVSSMRTVNIKESPDRPGIIPLTNTSICEGSGDVQLKADPATSTSYRWFKENGATDIEITTQTTAVLTLNTNAEGGDYYVIAVGGDGCESTPSTSISVEIDLNPPTPDTPIEVSGKNSKCANESNSIILETNYLGPGTEYRWYKNTVNDPGTATPFNVSFNNPPSVNVTEELVLGDNYFFVQAENQSTECTSSISNSILITLFPEPSQPTISIAGDPEVCAPVAITLDVDEVFTTETYDWYVDGDFLVNTADPELIYNTPGNNQEISVVRISDDGCASSSSEIETISIYALPEDRVVTLTDIDGLICEGSSATILVENSQNNVDYILKEGASVITTVAGAGGDINLNTPLLSTGSYTYTVEASTQTTPACLKVMESSPGNPYSFTVDVAAAPSNVTFSTLTPEVCVNSQAELNVSISGGTAPYTVTYITDLNPTEVIVSSPVADFDITSAPLTNSSIFEIISITDDAGCDYDVSGIAKPVVTVDNPTSITVMPAGPVCYNNDGEVSFEVIGGIGDYTVKFNVNSGPELTVSGPSPLVYGDQPGETALDNLTADATINLISATTSNGCNIPPVAGSAVLQVQDPRFDLTSNLLEGCSYEDFALTVNVSDGDGPYDLIIENNRGLPPINRPGYNNGTPIPVNGIPDITQTIDFTVSSMVDNGAGCSVRMNTSGDVNIQVNEQPIIPSISITPDPAESCIGETVTLTTIDTEPGYTYEWVDASDNSTVQNDPNPDLVLSGVQNKSYRLRLISSVGCVGELSTAQNVIIYDLPPKPQITDLSGTPLSDQVVCDDENLVIYSTTAQADQYKWFRDGVEVGNGQNYAPVLSGNFTVETISVNNCVSERSDVLNVVINPTPAQPNISVVTPGSGIPEICDDAADANTIVLESNNPGNLADSYEWFKVSDPGTVIAATKTLTLTDESEEGSYQVRIRTADNCLSIYSAPQAVLINPEPAKPNVVTSDPDNAICGDGSTITLTALPNPGIEKYIWYRNGFGEIQNGVSNELVLDNTDVTGDYYVIAEAAGPTFCQSLQSDPTTININPIPGTPSIVLASAADEICEDGSMISLEVQTPFPSDAEDFNWYKTTDLSTVVGTGNRLDLNSVEQSGDFVVTAVGVGPTFCDGNTSTAYSVTVNPLPAPPVINFTSSSGTLDICDNGGTSFVTLTATSPDGNAFDFDWFLDGNPFASGTSEITVNQQIQSGDYTAVGYGIDNTNCPSALSLATTVNIFEIPVAPLISGAASLCAGAENELYVIDNDVTGASFNWNIPAGVDLVIGGESSQSFVIVDLPTAGNYSISATQTLNGCESPVGGIDLNVLDPTVTDGINGPVEICENQTDIEYVVISPTPGSTYSWNVPNGASFSVISQSKISVDFGTAAQAGVSPFIEVVETNLAGCVSAPVNLPVTISELPTAVLSGDATVCFGKSTDLQIELSGAGPWELKYAANSGGPAVTNTISIPDAPTPHIYDLSVSPMVTTNYSLISVTDGSSNNCEAISVSGNAFVEVLPEPALNAGVNQSIAQGSFAALNPVVSGTYTNVQWTSDRPGDGSFNNANLLSPVFTPNVSATGDFLLTIELTDANGFCDPITDQLTITVNPAGTVDAGPDQTICDDGSIALLSATDPPTSGYTDILWESDRPGDGSFSNPLAANPQFQPNPGATGDFILTAKYQDNDGSDGFLPDTEDFLTITVNPLPEVSFDNVDDIIVCEGSGDVDLDLTLTGNGPWTVSYTYNSGSEQSFNVAAGNNNYTFTVPASALGDNVYTLTNITENNGEICDGNVVTGFESVKIIRRALPDVSITSSDVAICDDGSVATITVDLTGIGPWNLTYFDGTNSNVINNITTSSYSFDVSGIPGNTTTYSITNLVENNGASCSNTISGESVDVINNLRPTGVISIPPADATICEGSGTDLNVALTGSGPWEIVYTDGTNDFTFTSTDQNTSQLIPISPSVGSTNYTLTGIRDLTTMCVSVGADLTGNALITVKEGIQVDDLTDRTILQSTTTTFSANAIGDYTKVEWMSDRPGIFTSPGALSTDFTPSETGLYNITFTASDETAICTPPVAKSFVLTVVESADAIVDAGPDGESCQGQPILLAATVGSSYSDEPGDLITWSHDGTGTIGPDPADPTNPAKAEYTPDGAETGAVNFTVQVSDASGVAPDNQGEVTYTIFQTPNASIVSNNQIICNDGSSEATIVISMEGKGPWELTYSDGSTDFTIPVNTATYNLNVMGTPGTTTTYSLVSVSSTSLTNCVNNGLGTSVNITNRELPTAEFQDTTPITLCDDGSQASITLDLTGTGPWTLVWQDDFNAVENTTTINALPFNLNVSGVVGETVTYSIIRVTENNGVSCTNNDLGSLGLGLDIQVTKNRRPTASISGNPVICEIDGTESATLDVALTGVGPFELTYEVNSNQTVLSIPDINPNADPSDPFTVSFDVMPGSVGTFNYTLTEVVDLGVLPNCVSLPGDLSGVSQVTVKPKIIVDPLADRSMMEGGALNLSGTASGSYTKVEWTIDPDEGNFTPPNILNTSFQPLPSQVGAYTVMLTATDESGVCTTPGTSLFTLTINPSDDATLNAGLDETVCEGETINLDAEVGIAYTNEPGDVVTWSTPNGTGTLTQDAGDPSLATYVPDGNESSSVQFIISVEDASGIAEDKSDIVIYTIRPLPGAEFLSNDVSICEDGSIDLTVRFTGTAPWDFKYEKNGAEVVETGIATPTFNITANGSDGTSTYGITEVSNAFNSNGTERTCLVNISGEDVTVTALPLPIVAIVDDNPQIICDDGSNAVIELNITNGIAPWTMAYQEDGIEKTQNIPTANYSWSIPGASGETISYVITGIQDGSAQACRQDLTGLGLEVEITKNKRPTAVMSGTQTICEVDGTEAATLEVELTGYGPFDLTYELNSDLSTIEIPDINPSANPDDPFTTTFEVIPGSTGTFNYSIIGLTDKGVAPPCNSQAGDLSGSALVTVKPRIIVQPLTDRTILQGTDLNLNGVVSGSFTEVLWSIAPDEGLFTPDDNVNTTFTPDPAQTGTFIVTLTATDELSSICNADQQSFTLTINPTEDAVVDAGGPQTVCENENIDLSATIGAAYTDVSWSHNGTGSLVQYAGDPSRATYIPAAGETGIIQFTVEAEDENDIAPDKSDNVLVTINPLPDAEIISGNDIICDNGSTSTITVSLTGTGPWDIEYTDGTDNFTLLDITTPTYSFDVPGKVNEDVTYSLVQVTEKNGPSCVSVITGENVVITKRALPAATILDVDVTELCDDGSLATIAVEFSGNGPWNLTWKENISGVENLVPNITTSNYELKVPGVVGNPAIYSLVSVTENDGVTCSQNITDQDVDITKFNRPTGALSGDQTICEGGTADLDVSLTGTGPWEIIYQEGSVNQTYTANNAVDVIQVTPPVGTISYTLVSVTDLATGCVSVSGDLSGSALVTVKPEIEVQPLTDRTLLQGNTLNLSGTVNGAFTLLEWSIDPAEGSFIPANNLNTTYTPGADQVGNYTVYLKAFDDPSNICSMDEESFTLTINPSGDAVVDAGSPQTTCEDEKINLNATIGVAFTDVFWETNGSGTLVQDIGDPSLATYQPADGETGTIQFTVTASDLNGIAPTTSDNVPVTINKLPTAEITSPDRLICDDGSTTTITVSMTGAGPWDITYNDGTSDIPISDITTRNYDITVPGISGAVTYTLISVVEKNGAVCIGNIVNDNEVTVTTRELPTAKILSVDNSELCDDGSQATIQVELTGTGPWDLTWQDNVNGVNNLITDINSSPYDLVVPGIAGQTVTYSIVRVVEKNGVNCPVDITGQEVDITKNFRPTGVLTGSATICENGSTILGLTLTGTGPWDVIYTDGSNAFSETLNNADAELTVTPDVGATTFSLVNITDQGTGCTSVAGDLSGTPLLNVKSEITVTPLPDRNVLQGFSIDFVGEANGAYTLIEWESDRPGVFSSPNSLSTTFTPQGDQTGDYMITFRALDDPSNICSADETSFTLTITPTDDAVVFAGEDQTVCEGEVVDLKAIIGAVYTDISWTVISGAGSVIGDGVEPNNATYQPSGGETGIVQIRVTATDVNGVAPDKSDDLLITINPTPTVEIITGDRIICDDGSEATITLGLTGNGPWDVVYNDGLTDITITDITNPTHSFQVTGRAGETVNYTIVSVTSKDEANCAGGALGTGVNITRNNLPEAQITSGDVVLCNDGSMAEIVVALTGTGPWDLIWSDGVGSNFISGITSSPYSFFVPGIAGEDVTYSITGIFENDGTSCFSTVSDQEVIVSRNERPTAAISGSTTLCEGENALLDFQLTGVGPWEIEFSDGINTTDFITTVASFQQTYEVTPSVGFTNYSLINLIDLGTGCDSQTGDLTGTALVEVNPAITVDVGSDKTILANQSTLISAIAAGGFNDIEWTSTGNGTFSPDNLLNTTYSPEPEETGTFVIRLTARDLANVCTPEFDELTLNVIPIDAANVFAGTGYTICEGSLAPLNASIGSAYEEVTWSGGSGIFDNPNASLTTYTPASGELGNITLTITATDNDGIFAEKSDQIVIEVLQAPFIVAGDKQITCQGSAVHLNASLTGNNTDIQWTTDGIGSFSNSSGLTTFYIPTTDETGPVTMTVTANDPLSLCQAVSDELVVTFQQEISVTVSEELTLCQGSSVSLQPEVQGENVEYEWSSSGNGSFDDVNSKDVIHTPSEDEIGRFNLFITVSDPTGICEPVTNFFTINVLPKIEADYPELLEVCQGNSIRIDGNVVGTYSSLNWSTNSNGIFSDPVSATTTYTPDEEATGEHILTLSIEDGSGLCDQVEIQVAVDIKPEVVVYAGEDKSSIQREPVVLNDAIVSGDYSNLTWTSSGSGSFNDPNALNTTYQPGEDETGQIALQLTATDESGLCSSASDIVIIDIAPFTPIPEFEVNPDTPAEGCAPLRVSFNNNTEFGFELGYRWDFGDGIGTSTEREPTYTYIEPGVYTVKLTASNEIGTEASVVKEDMIIVHPDPVPLFELEEELVFYPSPVKIMNLSRGATEFIWDFGDGTSSNLEEPEHIYEQEGIYDITLTVKNEFGCEEKVTITGAVEVKEGGDVKVPNAFSPDPSGPSGGSVINGNPNNDIFIPVFEGVSKFNMQIFNRWGERIFESFDQKTGWDGYFRGQLSPPGIYIYKIQLEFSDGRSKTLVGDVTLVN
jgi:gliding motility-associated-like protein